MGRGRSDNDETEHRDGVLPSAFMRQLRPEIYSDSAGHTDYQLDAPLLEYHLNTLTSRNQTHDFEIFCRKLSEHAICPNLRAQTGPDGGGDSKADAESFPVADEISDLFYEGSANSGRERWGFAFSAKERWKKKVRDDVQGLVGTGRAYDRIICITSRFAKSKDRAALEDELAKLAGIPVTIHDRTWIVDQVIGRGRKDLAYHYLGVGTEITDAHTLGPTDYSRTQQLDKIEGDLANPAAYAGIERDRVIDALLAAKLSRGLERSRVETDGRFERAIRLADKYGALHQRVEARYECIWTAYWWHDDFAALDAGYDEIQALATDAGHARTLGFLVNLGQLLFSSVMHAHLDRVSCRLDERIARIVALLQPMANNGERPNNQLEAQAALLQIEMNRVVMAGDRAALSQIWHGFSEILDRASGLGEFDVERITKLIEVASNIAGDDPSYSALIDKLADFIAERTGEAQGALVLLRRAEKLELTHHFEMIRLLSKAAVQLTKKEHSADLIDALCLLAIAYRSAGLYWAARATCVFAMSTMFIEAEEGDRLPLRFGVVAKLWATLSLDLLHCPDFIVATRMAQAAVEHLPYRDEDREKFRGQLRDHEMIAASRIINLSTADLARLADWPDIFEANDLFMPRAALLYALGYADKLRADGSIPPNETEETVVETFSMLAGQPAGSEGNSISPVLNAPEGTQLFKTTLLGMRVEVHAPASDGGILVAESVIGSLEAFFATTIEHRVMPHTEAFAIHIVEYQTSAQPVFTVDHDTMTGTLTWPAALPPTRFSEQIMIRDLWLDVAAQVLGATCLVPDAERVLRTLTTGERVYARMALVTAAPNSYHRMLGRYLMRPADLADAVPQSYPQRENRPAIEPIDVVALAAERSGRPAEELLRLEPGGESHRNLGVRSVIDLHLWDAACWRGTGFAENQPGYPPFFALLFEDEDAASKIFARWRERIGVYDENERIRLSVIRRLPGRHPAHYSIQISANPLPGELEAGQVIAFTARSLVAEPQSETNLESFLASYRHYGAYYLIPAIWQEGLDQPRFLLKYPLLKRQLNVIDADEATDQDIERIAVEQAREVS